MKREEFDIYFKGIGKKSADEYIKLIAEKFSPQTLGLATSFQWEDQVLTWLLSKSGFTFQYFTIDTGRLPQETYEIWEQTERFFNITIEPLIPSVEDVKELFTSQGVNGFYASLEDRKRCCSVRKVIPLSRKLNELDGWFTGLRRGQALSRSTISQAVWDENYDIAKFNLLTHWNLDQVQEFVKENKIPLHPLYEKGFTSIGCAPCTRAVKAGDDIRAGRWWWEEPEKKECGLHSVKEDK